MLSALVCAALFVSQPTSKTFPLGVWYEGGVGAFRHNLIPDNPAQAGKLYLSNFQDIAAHGCNVAVAPNSSPEHHKAILDAAQQAGIRLILELGHEGGPIGEAIRKGGTPDAALLKAAFEERLKPIQDHPALLRVQLLDEPWKEVMPTYASAAQVLKEFNPKISPFCCVIEGDNAAEFLRVTGSDVVAFDCYPLGNNVAIGDEKALAHFDQVAVQAARAAFRNHADAWAVIQCHAITDGLRYPTPAELRRMTHAALAAGCRGIFWFLYQTEWLDPVKKIEMDGLVDWEYKARPLWEEVGKLTKEIKSIAGILSHLRPMAQLVETTTNGNASFLVDPDFTPYVYLRNPDVAEAKTIELKLAGASLKKGLRAENAATRDRIEVEKTGQDYLLKIPLVAGGGVLLRLILS